MKYLKLLTNIIVTILYCFIFFIYILYIILKLWYGPLTYFDIFYISFIFFLIILLIYKYLDLYFWLIDDFISFIRDSFTIISVSQNIREQIIIDNRSPEIKYYQDYIEPILLFIFVIYGALYFINLTFSLFEFPKLFGSFAFFIMTIILLMKYKIEKKYVTIDVLAKYYEQKPYKELFEKLTCGDLPGDGAQPGIVRPLAYKVFQSGKGAIIAGSKNPKLRTVLIACSLCFSGICSINYAWSEFLPHRRTPFEYGGQYFRYQFYDIKMAEGKVNYVEINNELNLKLLERDNQLLQRDNQLLQRDNEIHNLKKQLNNIDKE